MTKQVRWGLLCWLCAGYVQLCVLCACDHLYGCLPTLQLNLQLPLQLPLLTLQLTLAMISEVVLLVVSLLTAAGRRGLLAG
jgi:hypothetical protein